ncbi:hypothetical protein [Halarcobacter sp.]|uniref:hypothetical protein n=1 Tax=Halarcobacter sp. TaxID=2321133 RepID=UPI002AA7E507|nr:hypothetical protein [Halarcobacter sp.]
MVFLKTKTIEEKIRLAKTSSDKKIQTQLSRSYQINVRRALAKNQSLCPELANSLLYDPSTNVAFHASNNPNCTKKRAFLAEDLAHKCVKCDVDELIIDCDNCHL